MRCYVDILVSPERIHLHFFLDGWSNIHGPVFAVLFILL